MSRPPLTRHITLTGGDKVIVARHSRLAMRIAGAVVFLLGAVLLSNQTAFANGAALAAGPTFIMRFPTNVSVGETNVPASMFMENNSSSVDGAFTISSGSVKLVPSCGTFMSPAYSVNCPAPDTGVFSLSATGTGAVGTDCAGQVFHIDPVAGSTTGEVQFDGPPIVLHSTVQDSNHGWVSDVPLAGSGGKCQIDLTVNVLKLPTIDAAPSFPGTQTNQLGSAQGVSTIGNLAAGYGSSSASVFAAPTGGVGGIATSPTPAPSASASSTPTSQVKALSVPVPTTGTQNHSIAKLGIGLLAMGVLLLVLSRRRGHETTT